MSQPPQRAISFQDTSYGRRSCGRPKSGNIAVLSPHPPVSGPLAPADRAVVILGFADRGSPDLAGRQRLKQRDGRPLKILTVVDEYSREALAIVVARRLRVFVTHESPGV